MQRKRRILILLLLIIGICAVSTASAADDVDVLSADDANLEETSTELEDNEENSHFKPRVIMNTTIIITIAIDFPSFPSVK